MWSLDAYGPLVNLFKRNTVPCKNVQYTVNDPVSGQHTTTQRSHKTQCITMEMKHGRLTGNM